MLSRGGAASFAATRVSCAITVSMWLRQPALQEGDELEVGTCFGCVARLQVIAEALQESPPNGLPHVQLWHLQSSRCG